MEHGPEATFWNAPDHVPLFYRCYPGPRSDYYYSIIHGFAEHSARYTRLIKCLQTTGRTVLVYDLRGHGLSGGLRGLIRFWPQPWQDFIGLTAYLKQRKELPDCRTILIGHSLGGLIALDGALRDPGETAGLILSSPCLGLPLAWGLQIFNRLMAQCLPFFEYARPVKTEDLSRDAAVCRAYEEDGMILKSIRAQTLREMLRAGDSLEKSGGHLRMPLWLLAAGNERVVDLNRTLRVYAKLEGPFKKLKIFEAFRHEIFNEVQSEIAYDTVLQAIEQIVEFNSKSEQKIS